jgi:RHS repeat-associated protein
VSHIREKDLVTGQEFENEMIYHDAHYNPQFRQFQGFAEVEKIEKGDDSCPDKRLVYSYLMGQEYESGNGPEHVALNGKLQIVETYAMDGTEKQNIPFTTEASTYKLVQAEAAANGEQRVTVFLDTYSQTHLERSEDRRVEEKKYRYDAFGNVETEFIRAFGTEEGNPKPEIVSEIRYQYAVNKEKWILDRVAVVAVLDGSGNITGETRKYYDGEDFIGLELGKVTKGLEMREARFVMHKIPFRDHYGSIDLSELGYREEKDSAGVDAIFIDFKRSKFDQKGLRTGEMDAMGSTIKIVFDASGLFREKYISTLGENAYITDRKTGTITQITGPDNSVLRMNYDAMGRLTEVFSPDNVSAVPSRSYQFDTSALPLKRITKFYSAEDINAFSRVITYFDGASKEIQNRIVCEDGKFAVSEYKLMNPLGKVKKEFQPYFSNSEDFEIPVAASPNQTFTYDVMARPLKTINFYGGISTAIYKVYSVITSDPIDNSTDNELIARGLTNTPKTERFNVVRDRTETIVSLEDNKETVLRYTLNEWGQLEAVADDHGVVATYLYDHQGNRLQTKHREAGERKVWYNALKQPVKGTDANGNEINAQYDNLNRIQKLIANGNEVESYTYDNASKNGIGRLSEVTFEKGKQAFTYDANGQLIEKSFDFTDRPGQLVMKYRYDRMGRRTAIEHNDGTSVNYEYTPNGWVKRIQDIVKNIEYDAMGNPLAIAYENGVQTTYTFEDGGRKIRTQHSVNNNNQLLEQLEYNYYSDGSLKRFTDKTTSQPIVQDYEYNALNAITKNNVGQGGNTESHIYEYEDHLNLRTMGDSNSVLFREHPDKPAQISKLRTENGTETAMNYDDNGNLLNLPGRAFTYNFKNGISRLDRDDGLVAEYFYNHREDRVQKTVTNGALSSTTFFLDKEAEYKDSQRVLFVYLGNIRVALIKNGATSWVHANYLGNTNFYTDAAGTKISSISYRPFGNIANSTNNLPTHTFGTHPYDEESGLYYAKKRYYAPEIGCFMSPDPVAVFMPKRVIGSIKAFQCYAYAGNDPANIVDLSGLSFWSVFGAVVGAIVGVALVVFAGPLAALIIGIGIITLSYILASNNVNNDFGEFMRGFMIGFNAGMNAAIGTILFGPLIGTALGVINFLAAFDSIAQNEVYKGILGWSSWLMPMSWVVNGLGLIFFVINLIVAGVTFQQADRVKIHSISVNWQTGMLIMEGGLITYPPGGFNMGNFSFYGQGQTGVIDHELGHGLNLGAFGWVFHFVGAIDENLVQTNMHDAYSEHLAESNQATPDHAPPTPQLDMWTA